MFLRRSVPRSAGWIRRNFCSKSTHITPTTHIVYDFESTGLSPQFDQITQAGFARCQVHPTSPTELLQVTDTLNLKCRLQSFIVPSPRALVVTNMHVEHIMQAPLTLYELVTQVRDFCLQSGPSTFWGFNSLQFDEEVLRNSLWRNLYPAFLTNTDGNCRGDVLNLVRALVGYHKDCIKTGHTPAGNPSLRLEFLTKLNGIQHNEAHDALSDVRATVDILNLVHKKSGDVLKCGLYSTVKQRLISCVAKLLPTSLEANTSLISASNNFHETAINMLEGEDFMCIQEVIYGRMTPYAVKPLFINPEDPNELVCYNLDAPIGKRVTDKQLLDNSRKILRYVRINKNPVLLPGSKYGTAQHAKASAKLVNKHSDLISRAYQLMPRRKQDFEHRMEAKRAETAEKYPIKSQEYPEETIYSGGFVSSGDRMAMNTFHSVDWEEKLEILDRLVDRRMRYFGIRFLAEYGPAGLLPENVTKHVNIELAARLLTELPGAPWRTIHDGLKECAVLKKELEGEHKDSLPTTSASHNEIAQMSSMFDGLNDAQNDKLRIVEGTEVYLRVMREKWADPGIIDKSVSISDL